SQVSGSSYFALSALTTITANSGSDTTAVANTTYYYVVKAINAQGSSPNSAEARARLGNPAGPPAPTGLTATKDATYKITLTWNAVSGASAYNVLRSTVHNGNYAPIN